MNEEFATRWIDLAQPRLGSKVVFATDEFFAPKERLIDPPPPVFIADKYDDHGKWMDGWETRRRRDGGHDHCIVHLGVPGIIKGVDIDTSHFTGNYPPRASLDACATADEVPGDDVNWFALIPMIDLRGDSHHTIAVDRADRVTHVRLNIFPDGGVARLRVFGRVAMDWSALDPGEAVDLAAMALGGRPVACNDAHFGAFANIIAPGRARHMGDGWETRRRRSPGHDWGIVALAHPGRIEEILIDTAHFKGNYPDRFFLQAAMADSASDDELIRLSEDWPILLPEQKLGPDQEQRFCDPIRDVGPVSHVRLNIIPDGGVGRLRLMGRIA